MPRDPEKRRAAARRRYQRLKESPPEPKPETPEQRDLRRARRKRYYARNRERMVEKARAYRAANLRKVQLRQQAYYLAHREERIAAATAYREANRERIRERRRKAKDEREPS